MGGVFDHKSIVLLLEVFDEIIVDLDLRTDADREKAAKIIIRLTRGQADLDATKLVQNGRSRPRPFRINRTTSARLGLLGDWDLDHAGQTLLRGWSRAKPRAACGTTLCRRGLT
jgi:hypothetical protein